VLYDSDHVEAKPEWEKDFHHIAIPISGLTVEANWGDSQGQGQKIFCARPDRQDVHLNLLNWKS